MNDENNRKHWARRFEFWLLVAACLVACVLLGIGGCVASEQQTPGARGDRPEPASVLRSFEAAGGAHVTEFRDSAGRVCVLATIAAYDPRGGRAVALDCGRPLPPLDYEQLPGPAVTPIPRSELERQPQ